MVSRYQGPVLEYVRLWFVMHTHNIHTACICLQHIYISTYVHPYTHTYTHASLPPPPPLTPHLHYGHSYVTLVRDDSVPEVQEYSKSFSDGLHLTVTLHNPSRLCDFSTRIFELVSTVLWPCILWPSVWSRGRGICILDVCILMVSITRDHQPPPLGRNIFWWESFLCKVWVSFTVLNLYTIENLHKDTIGMDARRRRKVTSTQALYNNTLLLFEMNVDTVSRCVVYI